ncbi:hypothetical protein BD311DRAFT_822472 [Dichomitus squalens]|uniref:Uncharacterized protein n=1 Tax=Dichomitus squalens TaxID=114155 RepID=A0A4Q9M706_9APHY|nr:hypothetical protein BD311DRAFT_822472 [Dichomitus squalens]
MLPSWFLGYYEANLGDLWLLTPRKTGTELACVTMQLGRLMNPTEKISSGYKAWEFMYYFYGLLPGLLWAVQKPKYYWHFCKLVAGSWVSLLMETPVSEQPLAHTLLVEYVEEFEEVYYARRVDRLHFCRQALHALVHLMPENIRVGPAWLHSQWPLKNAIGNLTAEIGSHSKPFENLSLQGLQRAQVSALVAMFPETLEVAAQLPRGAIDLGDQYALLHPTMRNLQQLCNVDSAALIAFLGARGVQVPDHWIPRIVKWGRLHLPGGQYARMAWKECEGERRGHPVHRSRMVKLTNNSFAEVQYFFRLKRMLEDGRTDDIDMTLAMISLFIPPDPAIARNTYGTLLACRYQGVASCEVIDVKDIASVVVMVPLAPRREEAEDPCADELYSNRFYVVERLGFDSSSIGREEIPAREDDCDNDEYTLICLILIAHDPETQRSTQKTMLQCCSQPNPRNGKSPGAPRGTVSCERSAATWTAGGVLVVAESIRTPVFRRPLTAPPPGPERVRTM